MKREIVLRHVVVTAVIEFNHDRLKTRGQIRSLL